MKDRDFLVMCAVRYCLGRQSYIISTMTGYLIANAATMSEACSRVIIRDIVEADRDARLTSHDRAAWMDALGALRSKRKPWPKKYTVYAAPHPSQPQAEMKDKGE